MLPAVKSSINLQLQMKFEDDLMSLLYRLKKLRDFYDRDFQETEDNRLRVQIELRIIYSLTDWS